VRENFKRTVPKYVAFSISQDLLEAVFEGARNVYPRETILLLRGKKEKDVLSVTDLIIPPLANYGRGFSNIPLYMLPMDFSIIGTAHSHPSGNLAPSHPDLNHFFGPVLMIVGFPFTNEKNVAVYNRNGERLILQVTNP
jgi:proteasome lid subunit RPN8/RPN11